MSLSERMPALEVAYNCRGAYSADRWGSALWVQAAQMILDMGFTESEAEDILRSKMTRWARDSWGNESTFLGQLAILVSENRDVIKAGEFS